MIQWESPLVKFTGSPNGERSETAESGRRRRH